MGKMNVWAKFYKTCCINTPNMNNSDLMLPVLQFAINTSYKEGTKHTAFFENYSKRPRTPMKFL
ncbi:hypothetical protein ABBQ32_007662 [Trebouxia sp. C0010 RCD-2024]